MAEDEVIRLHEYDTPMRARLFFRDTDAEDLNFLDEVQSAILALQPLVDPGILVFDVGGVDDGWAEAMGEVDGEQVFQGRTPVWEASGLPPFGPGYGMESWTRVTVDKVSDWMRTTLEQARPEEGMHAAWDMLECGFGAATIRDVPAVMVDGFSRPVVGGRAFGPRLERDRSPVQFTFLRFGYQVTLDIEYAWTWWTEGDGRSTLDGVIRSLEALGWVYMGRSA